MTLWKKGRHQQKVGCDGGNWRVEYHLDWTSLLLTLVTHSCFFFKFSKKNTICFWMRQLRLVFSDGSFSESVGNVPISSGVRSHPRWKMKMMIVLTSSDFDDESWWWTWSSGFLPWSWIMIHYHDSLSWWWWWWSSSATTQRFCSVTLAGTQKTPTTLLPVVIQVSVEPFVCSGSGLLFFWDGWLGGSEIPNKNMSKSIN